MDQYYGVNTWARDLLSATVKVTESGRRTFPDGNEELFERTVFVPTYKTFVVAPLSDAQPSNGYWLYRYEFLDGNIYEEFVQEVTYYAGPCYFIALKHNGDTVEESLWKAEEMRVN